MRLPGWILTAVIVIALNFSIETVYARTGNRQCLQKKQSLLQAGRATRQNQKGSRICNNSNDRKRLRDGSCVNPSLYGK